MKPRRSRRGAGAQDDAFVDRVARSRTSTTAAPAPIPQSMLGRMPASIAPMLAAEAPEPFDSPDHIFELMWGGVRAMAYVRDGVVRLRARNGRDLTPYFPELLCISGPAERARGDPRRRDRRDERRGAPGVRPAAAAAALMATAVGPDREQVPQLPVQFRLKKIAGTLSFSGVRPAVARRTIARWSGRCGSGRTACTTIVDGGRGVRAGGLRRRRGHRVLRCGDRPAARRRRREAEERARTRRADDRSDWLRDPGAAERRLRDRWLRDRRLAPARRAVQPAAAGGVRRRGGSSTSASAPAGLPDKEARELVELLEPLHCARVAVLRSAAAVRG